MGKLVRLIGTGIGLASEAIAARKATKAEKAALEAASSSNSQSSQRETGESSRTASQRTLNDDAPPVYAEVEDDHASRLIASGKAVPVDSKEELAVREKYAQHEAQEADYDTASEERRSETWDLEDVVQSQTTPPSSVEGDHDEVTSKDPTTLTDAFMRSHPPPPAYDTMVPKPRLPCPVILPQRRPRDKKRGFVRAYAPVLEDCGIDQATFLDFLKTFHTASKSSPWLSVVNIAAAGAGFVPNHIAMGVSIAVQFAVGVAMEIQARTRSNTFLDRMNDEFFKPRGLYCLILTYKPELASSTHASVDINAAISTYANPAASGFKSGMRNLRVSSGKTYGEWQMPEAAPLIFPGPDAPLRRDPGTAGAKEKSSKLKEGQKFVAGYFDRRAQAIYERENPGSVLARSEDGAGEGGFASRYADPNHPASSGSWVGLLTGGALDLRGEKEMRRGEKRARRAVRRGVDVTPEMVRGERPEEKREGVIKKMLKKDVLYMMIVNLPSEEELAAGKQAVRQHNY